MALLFVLFLHFFIPVLHINEKKKKSRTLIVVLVSVLEKCSSGHILVHAVIEQSFIRYVTKRYVAHKSRWYGLHRYPMLTMVIPLHSNI